MIQLLVSRLLAAVAKPRPLHERGLGLAIPAAAAHVGASAYDGAFCDLRVGLTRHAGARVGGEER